MKYELPKLLYEFNALEPYIDTQTMEIHYTKHHGGYVAKLNVALEKYPELEEKTLEELLLNIEGVPEDIRKAVNNNGWQYLNHSFFWECLTPNSAKKPSGNIETKINETFGSFDKFKEIFTEKAVTLFGSGWVWLVKDKAENLEIITTSNEANPIKENKTPLMVIDVWEHAYYLKYQNRRNEFIENWWNVINWKFVESQLA